ncbi:response regulator transcription factor [Actinomyces vulturis]|uniref:response regulator transcription factor n=1 Tax=Actinomyces vulturis TaxID=1857645 RepID=UPI00082C540E|nr:response regulator transcription factor [Actinomyces vulturis]
MSFESVNCANVALVEDHTIISVGVSAILNTADDLNFVGGFPTVRAFFDHYQDAGGPFPEVVLLDLRLGDDSTPAGNVAALLAEGIAVIVYTSGEDPYLVRQACEAGVLGVVRKAESPDVLISTIRRAVEGELTPSLDWASALDSDTEFVTTRLNDTERLILTYYASGAAADFIARRIHLSPNTVNKYIGNIRKKFMDAGMLDVSRVDLLRQSQREGLLPTSLDELNHSMDESTR